MNDKFYFVVAGSREYQNYIEFSHIMDMLLKNYDYKKLVIVSGGARGTDKMAEQYCEEHNIENIVINAEWDKHKIPGTKFNPAGFIRNRKMHEYIVEHADYDHRGCICFWDNDGRGTSNNFTLCEEFNTRLVIYNWIIHKYMNPNTVKGYKYKMR